MKEPSRKTGKTIQTIKVSKNAVRVIFPNETLLIPTDYYLDHHLYKDKVLTSQEYQELKQSAKDFELIKKAISLASRGTKSTKEIKEELLKKTNDLATVNRILAGLKAGGYINDDTLKESLIDSYNYRLYGERYIKAHLAQKGLFEEESSDFGLKALELEKAEALIEIFKKKYARDPLNKRKQKIFNAFVAKGYDQSLIAPLVNEIRNTKEQDAYEYENCKKAFMSLYKDKEDLEDFKRWSDLFGKLLRRGYNMADINKAREELTK